MSDVISNLLTELKIHPVLVDVGSSGAAPKIWEKVAKHSTYVGFDPDLRETQEITNDDFSKKIIINEAVTITENSTEVLFYLTASPYCSSILKPDAKSLRNFLFANLFAIEAETKVSSITINAVINRLSLTCIDWLKIDSQGTDLRIFNSLRDELAIKLLAVDVEPGLIDAYIGEDLFVDTHKNLVSHGFWLSNLNICGSVRIKRETIDTLGNTDKEIDSEFINSNHRKSPGWCEARYFRTIDYLDTSIHNRREYVLLWIFSMLDRQLGFAVEIVLEYENKFGKDEFSQAMLNESIWHIKHLRPRSRFLRDIAGNLLPVPIKRWLKNVFLYEG